MAFVKKFCLRLLVVGALALLAAMPAQAQDDPEIRITDIDLSNFPTVGVRLLTRDAGSAPIADLSTLVLRENRAPIPEFELARVPTGTDLVLVIDANDTILQDDAGDGLARRDKVAASVERYARQYMNPTGLDRVTVIVPDEAGGVAVLGEDLTRPQDVAQVVAAYQPQAPPRVTPLNDMLTAALDNLAARRDDGRFQAVLLFTDGARLDQQLAYQDLVEAAQEGGVPFFGAILGATADPNEEASLARLAGPTRGRVIHMPEPEATDAFYQLFQGQSQQTEARYRSLIRRGGEVDVSASLGNTRTTASFTLDLLPPVLTLDLPQASIRRVGSAVDTPLPLLQPAVHPITATITWPDGIRRELTELAFLVNGRREPLPADISPDESGRVALAWDISNLDAGVFELLVEARDILGYEMSSGIQPVTITVDRPQPPTPTPIPTAVAVPGITLPGGLELDRLNPNDPIMWLAPVAFALLMLGVIGLWWAIRRWRVRRAEESAGRKTANQAEFVPPPPAPSDDHIPLLERLAADGSAIETVTLTARDTLIGRDPEHATLVLDDATVARLHARLRRTDTREFWLYDEGSTTGTFLNHTRLGLAPRPVQHGDHLQFGRVAFRFILQLPEERPAEPAGNDQPADEPQMDPAPPAADAPALVEENKGEEPDEPT